MDSVTARSFDSLTEKAPQPFPPSKFASWPFLMNPLRRARLEDACEFGDRTNRRNPQQQVRVVRRPVHDQCGSLHLTNKASQACTDVRLHARLDQAAPLLCTKDKTHEQIG